MKMQPRKEQKQTIEVISIGMTMPKKEKKKNGLVKKIVQKIFSLFKMKQKSLPKERKESKFALSLKRMAEKEKIVKPSKISIALGKLKKEKIEKESEEKKRKRKAKMIEAKAKKKAEEKIREGEKEAIHDIKMTIRRIEEIIEGLPRVGISIGEQKNQSLREKLKDEIKELEAEIKFNEELMEKTRWNYFKRRISEKEFRLETLKLQENIFKLKKKKEVLAEKLQLLEKEGIIALKEELGEKEKMEIKPVIHIEIPKEAFERPQPKIEPKQLIVPAKEIIVKGEEKKEETKEEETIRGEGTKLALEEKPRVIEREIIREKPVVQAKKELPQFGEKETPEKEEKSIEEILKDKNLSFEERMKILEVKRKGIKPKEERKKILIETEHPLMPLIKEKSTGLEHEERIKEIKEKTNELLEKMKVPKEEIEREIDQKKILQDFDKLINLIELEKEAKEAHESIIKLEELPLVHIGLKERQEKLKAIAKEIRKHEIITQIDHLLSMIKHEGIVSGAKAAKELSIPYKQVIEFGEILEQDGLIKLRYPALGSIKFVDPEFEKQKNKKKK